jgi:hypothetical protein
MDIFVLLGGRAGFKRRMVFGHQEDAAIRGVSEQVRAHTLQKLAFNLLAEGLRSHRPMRWDISTCRTLYGCLGVFPCSPRQKLLHTELMEHVHLKC